MRYFLLGAILVSSAVRMTFAQQSSVVNNSRSNIKNNITISRDPDGKVRCKVSGTLCTKDQIDQLNKAITSTNAAPDPTVKAAPPAQAPRATSTATDSQITRSPNEGRTEQATQATYSTTKSNIKGVGGIAPDGSVTCVAKDGKLQPCTATDVAYLNRVAAAMPGLTTR